MVEGSLAAVAGPGGMLGESSQDWVTVEWDLRGVGFWQAR